MFWLKAMADFASYGQQCNTCGAVLPRGKAIYLLIDADMKIVGRKCADCFHSAFPDGL